MTRLAHASSPFALRAAIFFVATVAAATVAAAAEPIPDTPVAETFAVHGQFTYVEQESSNFNAPYAGPNSLSPGHGAETSDATLYLGARLWRGAEAWVNGEIDQGFGLDDTLGVAGLPSGEAYKIGKNQPYLRLPRLFVRQTLNQDDASLDGARQAVDGGAALAAAACSIYRTCRTVLISSLASTNFRPLSKSNNATGSQDIQANGCSPYSTAAAAWACSMMPCGRRRTPVRR